MLISIESMSKIEKIPHYKEFVFWKSKINAIDYQNIEDELKSRIDTDEVHTAGWIPGSDWGGTVFEPIYDACQKNQTAAAQFFGLILFKVMMDHDDKWGFGRYELNGEQIQSMTYFRLKI